MAKISAFDEAILRLLHGQLDSLASSCEHISESLPGGWEYEENPPNVRVVHQTLKKLEALLTAGMAALRGVKEARDSLRVQVRKGKTRPKKTGTR